MAQYKCENCGEDIQGEPQYGYGTDIKWCSEKCWDEGSKRLARRNMTEQEREFFEWIDSTFGAKSKTTR